MTPEHSGTHTHPRSPTSARLHGGSRTARVRERGKAIAQHAKALVSELPTTAKEQLAAHPYRSLGLAFAVGVGAGVVLGNRILRGALTSAVSVALIELGRAYLQQEVEQELGIHPRKPAESVPS